MRSMTLKSFLMLISISVIGLVIVNQAGYSQNNATGESTSITNATSDGTDAIAVPSISSAKKKQENPNLLLDYFEKGGVFMYPLLILSIFALAFIIERSIYILPLQTSPKSTIEKIREEFDEGKQSGVINYLEENVKKKHFARVLLPAFKKADKTENEIERSVETQVNIELGFLERGLPALTALANIAPMIGFLGTVVGMIDAFQSLADAGGKANASQVASGIYQALITTAAGLIIAIPITIAHNYFISRIDRFTLAVEKIMLDMEELFQKIKS